MSQRLITMMRDLLRRALVFVVGIFHWRTMIEFSLFGSVHPLHYMFTLNGSEPLRWEGPDIAITFRPIIKRGHIEMICVADEYTPQILKAAHLGARVLLDGIINLHAFTSGTAYTVVLDAVQEPGSPVCKRLDATNPALVELCTSFTQSAEDSSKVWYMVMQDFDLMQILQDAIWAIGLPQYQPIGCGRVLDGIRNYIAPDVDVKAGWKSVHAALNVSEAYASFVGDRAKKPRHREKNNLTSEEVAQMLRHTWTIVDRFLIYCRRGKVALSAPEFPLL